MVSPSEIAIHTLTREFDLSNFKNERSYFRKYLLKEAFKDHESKIGCVFLFIYKPDKKIAGFVTLAMSNLPTEGHINLRKLTGYQYIPALLLGQMARSLDYAHVGMGRFLLDWVIDHGTKLSKQVGCRLIMLNSVPEKIKWYQDNGFILLEDDIMYMDLLEPSHIPD